MNNRSTRSKYLNLKYSEEEKQSCSAKAPNSPLVHNKQIYEEDSPYQLRCTQDGGEDELDVIWDWNSPQSRYKRSRKPRKRPTNKSPQVPRKVKPKSNLAPKFALLRAELEKLNSNVVEESKLSGDINDNKETPTNVENCDDLFGDDSFDDDLVRCSQQVEEAFTKCQHPQPQTLDLLINHRDENIADDSFDAVIEDFTEEQIEKLSQTEAKECKTPVKTNRTIYRTFSTPVQSDKYNALPRTKSAEECGSPKLSDINLAEIERKRQEAKVKQVEKAIEKRRLEALEKLKRNRLQRTKNNVR